MIIKIPKGCEAIAAEIMNDLSVSAAKIETLLSESEKHRKTIKGRLNWVLTQMRKRN